MRRIDTLLAIVVGAFAVFVGLKIATRPRPAPAITAEPVVTLAGDSARSIPAPNSEPASTATVVQTSSPAPERNLEQIRARIAETPGTYMADMLDDLKGSLFRWPDKRETGLRIWVQSTTPVRDWDLRYAQMARDAFDDWGRDALPIRFDFVNDSATSDIHVVWREKFAPENGARVGYTTRTYDQNGWLVDAHIDVAIHDSTGRTIPPAALVGIMRHEAGHALGMGHSRDPRSKMYPFERNPEIGPSDRATMRLLYQLPPGPAR
jgi:hypothetical protein